MERCGESPFDFMIHEFHQFPKEDELVGWKTKGKRIMDGGVETEGIDEIGKAARMGETAKNTEEGVDKLSLDTEYLLTRDCTFRSR